jgi:polyisoprenyl-teichoic acid--peptidoglycan teichoic acid transferase
VIDTKRMHVINIALVVILSLSSLALYTNFNNTVPDSDITLVQPCYKSRLDQIADNSTNNKEDLLIAILGTDERKNERSRSDVIIVLKYKYKENKVIVVSVPRDSKISIPGKGTNKINAASAFGGPRLQVDVLENLFKVSNMKYVRVNFEGFREIINYLGGIEVNAQKDFRRSWGKKDTYAKKGENILTGDDLLEYVRFRKDKEGDFGRIKRQQEVLLSFYSYVTKPENITNLPQIAMLVINNIDSDMNIFFIMRHLSMIEKLDTFELEFYTLKTFSEKRSGICYEIIDIKNLEYISDLLQN